METTQHRVVATGHADWAGTSTQYQYIGPDQNKHAERVSWKGHAEAVRRFITDLLKQKPPALTDLSHLAAVGHRVVHGGDYTTAIQITPDVRSRIEQLRTLAPLHNPPSLETLAAAEAELPNLPHIATFDTAFHSTLPPKAYTYPIPMKWTRDWGIRRFGFHGLSHAYCSNQATNMLDRPRDELRLVICHLGHGCSAAAVQGGRCLDTTMGFTPLDGLMMATRSGSIDPGILEYVQNNHGLSAEQVGHSLNHDSGLLGVSEISGDLRQLEEAANDGHELAQLAIGIYVHRIRQAIGALTVTLGGIDALIFTAGVGENSSGIRRLICSDLECLGLELDTEANTACQPDADIATKSSRGRILVIATREDLTMVREIQAIIDLSSQGPGGVPQVTVSKSNDKLPGISNS
ncbi:Acetate kinase [Symmachiella macrocystis]|uniref:Acetate kinase n=2 Tax=Symmachiella macrocystis TaxID=2527985 RepID=A0A5C6B197_9PLAN|nr:Acetate kinase [Symmachiella macrocystis]